MLNKQQQQPAKRCSRDEAGNPLLSVSSPSPPASLLGTSVPCLFCPSRDIPCTDTQGRLPLFHTNGTLALFSYLTYSLEIIAPLVLACPSGCSFWQCWDARCCELRGGDYTFRPVTVQTCEYFWRINS